MNDHMTQLLSNLLALLSSLFAVIKSRQAKVIAKAAFNACTFPDCGLDIHKTAVTGVKVVHAAADSPHND